MSEAVAVYSSLYAVLNRLSWSRYHSLVVDYVDGWLTYFWNIIFYPNDKSVLPASNSEYGATGTLSDILFS
jgi:hypothetical protein